MTIQRFLIRMNQKWSFRSDKIPFADSIIIQRTWNVTVHWVHTIQGRISDNEVQKLLLS